LGLALLVERVELLAGLLAVAFTKQLGDCIQPG